MTNKTAELIRLIAKGQFSSKLINLAASLIDDINNTSERSGRRIHELPSNAYEDIINGLLFLDHSQNKHNRRLLHQNILRLQNTLEEDLKDATNELGGIERNIAHMENERERLEDNLRQLNQMKEGENIHYLQKQQGYQLNELSKKLQENQKLYDKWELSIAKYEKARIVFGFVEAHSLPQQPNREIKEFKVSDFLKNPESNRKRNRKSKELKKSKQPLEYVDCLEAIDSTMMPIITELYKKSWGPKPEPQRETPLPSQAEEGIELPNVPSLNFRSFFTNLWIRALRALGYTINRNQPAPLAPPPAIKPTGLETHVIDTEYFPAEDKKGSHVAQTITASNDKIIAKPSLSSRIAKGLKQIFSRRKNSNPNLPDAPATPEEKPIASASNQIATAPDEKTPNKSSSLWTRLFSRSSSPPHKENQKPAPPPGPRPKPKNRVFAGGNLGSVVIRTKYQPTISAKNTVVDPTPDNGHQIPRKPGTTDTTIVAKDFKTMEKPKQPPLPRPVFVVAGGNTNVVIRIRPEPPDKKQLDSKVGATPDQSKHSSRLNDSNGSSAIPTTPSKDPSSDDEPTSRNPSPQGKIGKGGDNPSSRRPSLFNNATPHDDKEREDTPPPILTIPSEVSA